MLSRFALVILIGSLELSRFDRFPLAKFVPGRNSLEVYSSRDLKTMHSMKVVTVIETLFSCVVLFDSHLIMYTSGKSQINHEFRVIFELPHQSLVSSRLEKPQP